MTERPAQRIKEQVEAAGGQLMMSVSTLLYVFMHRELDSEAATEITAGLTAAGVSVAPSLDAIGSRPTVELRTVAKKESPPPSGPRPQPPPPPPPPPRQTAAAGSAPLLPPAVSAASPAAAAAGVSVGTAIAGAVIPALLLAVAFGVFGFWVYGVLFLALAGFGYWLIRYRLPWLVRIFFPRLPWIGVRSLLVGAIPVLVLAAVIGLAAVLPIHLVRTAEAHQRAARSDVRHANEAMDHNDLQGARDWLDRARRDDSSVKGINEADARLTALQGQAAEEKRKSNQYDAAVAAFASNDYDAAISGMEGLGDYRDARPQTQHFRVVASSATLAAGKKVLKSDPEAALGLATKADGYYSTSQTRSFVHTARAAAAAKRAADKRRQEEAAARRRAAAKHRDETTCTSDEEAQITADYTPPGCQAKQQELYPPTPPDTGSSGGSGGSSGGSSGGGGGTIICNDGYVWPGTTRQGACHGHGGIAN